MDPLSIPAGRSVSRIAYYPGFINTNTDTMKIVMHRLTLRDIDRHLLAKLTTAMAKRSMLQPEFEPNHVCAIRQTTDTIIAPLIVVTTMAPMLLAMKQIGLNVLVLG
jgi:hypothetical protein